MAIRRYFSPSTRGFYTEESHGPRTVPDAAWVRVKGKRRPRIANPDCLIPADAIAVSDALYAELMDAQAAGQLIAVVRGRLSAIDAPMDTAALASRQRARRDRLLVASDWTQLPDAPVDRDAWAIYRQQLRNLKLGQAIDDADWPTPPGGAA